MPSAEAATLVRGLVDAVAGLSGRIDGLELSVRDGWTEYACPGIPFPPFTALHAYDPAADARLAAALPEAVAEFDRRHLPPWLLLAHCAFPRTEAAARELGLTREERLPGMVVTPGQLPAPAPVAAAIARIGLPGLAPFATVAAEGFGLPAQTVALLCAPTMLDAPGVAYYLAETADGPACCTVSVRTNDALGIYLVGTVPEQRRRGLAAAVVARAAADGFAEGARLAYLQSSEMGYGVYRGLGFREVTTELRLSRPQVPA